MGQYYKVINKTKKEYLTPYTFGNGAKLMEFTSTGVGILQGLSILLANGNGRGGGDLSSHSPLIGSWSGDSISIEGDYADDTLWDEIDAKNSKWKDISYETYSVLLEDSWMRDRKAEEIRKHGTQYMFGDEKKLMEELFPKECIEGDLRQKFDFVEKEQSEE